MARRISRATFPAPLFFGLMWISTKSYPQKSGDLRDKQVLRTDLADTQRIQIQDVGGTFILTRKLGGSDDWTFESPVDRKGKPASGWKILDPLGAMRAEEVIDHPAPNLLAQLSSPAVRLALTGKDGKELTLRVSKPSGDFVYAQASGDAALYKLKKEVFGQLNLTAADLICRGRGAAYELDC